MERLLRHYYAYVYFFNKSVKNEPIWIIFDTQNPEEIWHK